MKKILFSLIALIIAFSSIAQKPIENKEYKMEKNEFKGHNGMNNLNLNKDQKRQLKVINEDFKQQMQSLKTDNTLTTKALKEKRENLVQEHKQKVDAILTPEQRMKAEELRSTSKNNGTIRKEKDGEDKLDKLIKDLDLTADQQTKVRALNENLKTEAENIEKNTSLTDDQKKEQLKSVRKKHNEELRFLLTTEQRAKLKIRTKNQPNRKAVK